MVKLNRTLLAITIVCVSYLLSAYGDEKTSTPQLKAKQTHYDLGIELIRKGNTNEAIAAFKEAIKLDPLYTEAHRKYIDLMERQGKEAEILEEYKGYVIRDRHTRST